MGGLLSALFSTGAVGGSSAKTDRSRNEMGQFRTEFVPKHRLEERGYKTPCHIWLGCKNNKGYGVRSCSGKVYLVHKVNYEEKFGPIPVGCELDHLCSVRECVNPDHLKSTTHTENCRRGKRAKLTLEQAREIRREYALPGKLHGRQSELARKYGVTAPTITAILINRTWKEVA